MSITVQGIVSERSPVHFSPPWNGPSLVLVLVRVPAPSHVAEQVPFVHWLQTQSTIAKYMIH